MFVGAPSLENLPFFPRCIGYLFVLDRRVTGSKKSVNSIAVLRKLWFVFVCGSAFVLKIVSLAATTASPSEKATRTRVDGSRKLLAFKA